MCFLTSFLKNEIRDCRDFTAKRQKNKIGKLLVLKLGLCV